MSTDRTALAPSSSSEIPAVLTTAGGVDHLAPVETSPTSDLVNTQAVNGQALVRRKPARVKPPKDSKVYKVVLAVIALRAQGVKAKEISDTLGYSEDVLRQYVSRAYKKGWINIQSFSEVDDQLEYILKHKIVENVSTALGERNDSGGLTSGAREMTVEAAKGLGLFKAHQIVKGDVASQIGVALRVEVAMPPAARQQSNITVRAGTIGGAAGLGIPADAEVIESVTEE